MKTSILDWLVKMEAEIAALNAAVLGLTQKVGYLEGMADATYRLRGTDPAAEPHPPRAGEAPPAIG